MTKKKLLIVEAHSDDAAIGAGGFLEKFRDRYEYHFLLMSVSDFTLHHAGFLTRSQRLVEYENYINHLQGVWHRLEDLPFDADALMDQVPKRKIVAVIEKAISLVGPDMLICQGSSFHHDHTITYEATIAATRPTARFCPQTIYIMENPTYVHSLGPNTDFKPDTYCSLTEAELEKKLANYRNFFPSQVREDSNYLSAEGIRAWARYRGIESRCRYAEAFRTYLRVI